MDDAQQVGRIVYRAIAVIVVADCAVEQVVAQNTVESFALRDIYPQRFGIHPHASGWLRCASPYQLAVNFNDACIAGLDRTHLRVIADLRNLRTNRVKHIHQIPGVADSLKGPFKMIAASTSNAATSIESMR